MLRLSLIIAIIAGLAAAALNFYQVRQVMVDLMTELESTKQTLVTTQADLSKTKKTLAKTEEDLATTKTKLTKSEADLKSTTANLAAKEKEAAELSDDLVRAKADRDVAQQLTEVWRKMNVTPDAVRAMIVSLDRTKEDLAITKDENKVLYGKVVQLTGRLETLVGTNQAPELPAGTKGKVVAVDPKFDFVIINIGGNSNLVERGELLVNRNGKLIGKIRIAAVQPNQSVANVMPEWKKEEIMEGDQVLY